MRAIYKAAIALMGLSTLASPATAAVVVDFGDTMPIPVNNDFQPELAGLELTQLATTDASLMLTEDSVITFDLLGSESGFNDTFSAGSVAYTEFTVFLNSFASPIALGSASFAAGNLAGLLNFTSSEGAPATVGSSGFGIYLGPGAMSGDALSVFYLGYDDQVTNRDDDFDDFVVRATVTPAVVVPEPTSWAMMLLGFGATGLAFRRKRRALITMA
jgi:hypothetical protein